MIISVGWELLYCLHSGNCHLIYFKLHYQEITKCWTMIGSKHLNDEAISTTCHYEAENHHFVMVSQALMQINLPPSTRSLISILSLHWKKELFILQEKKILSSQALMQIDSPPSTRSLISILTTLTKPLLHQSLRSWKMESSALVTMSTKSYVLLSPQKLDHYWIEAWAYSSSWSQ